MSKRKKGKRKAPPAPEVEATTLPVESRAYEGAMSTPGRRRVIGANNSQDAAADAAIEPTRDWGRFLDENHDLAVGILDDLVKNIVGSGIVTIPKPLREDGTVDDAAAKAIKDAWKPWTRACDVTGELTWHDAQRIICRSWLRDGEHFMQHVQGRNRGFPFSPTQVPYRVELLESEMVPWQLTDDTWRQGVRHNAWRQPIEYAVYRNPPNDLTMAGFANGFTDDMKRINARDMTHLKLVKRWPATRGISLFASVISRLYDIKDLEESERLKDRVLASWCAAITKSPDMPGQENTDAAGNRYLAMSSGTIIDTLAPGESIDGVGPDYPVANMPDHINDQIRRVASGTGTRHSSISKTYDGNYAAQRQEMVESEGGYRMRFDTFVQKIMRVVYERWLQSAITSGIVAVPFGADFVAMANAEYRGPATPWIDPLKETNADKMAVESGFITLEQVQIKRGMDEDKIGTPAPVAAPVPAPVPTQLSLVDESEDEEAAA